jgi:hypothetical protein
MLLGWVAGLPGACNAPLQAGAVTMQQNAAGVWGVPRFSYFSPPKNVGSKGLRLNVETPAADFAPLYPPYNWIPAFAGMTDYACITGKLRFVRAPHRGVQRGGAPLLSFLPPRVGDIGG